MSNARFASAKPGRVPDAASESRLLEIRRQAESEGRVPARGVRPSGAPFPVASPETGYYGTPLLKEPQWTWEIPLYFFTGGAAGSAAVIGALADWLGKDRELARDCSFVAFGGSLLSTALLIADLGRKERFLNMLRVFKPQSPMSVGAWTLVGFSQAAAASTLAHLLEWRFGDRFPASLLRNLGQGFGVLLGLPFHNYTGVLIAATAIPVWNENAATLPMHFGASGLGAGVSLLELLGHGDSVALNLLGMGAAAMECWEGFHLESQFKPALRPLKAGLSGWTTRAGGILSGPLPLLLRLWSVMTGSPRMRRAAACCGLLGSLLTRYGWVAAGRASARDWRLPLQIREEAKKPVSFEAKAPLPEMKAAS